VSVIHIEAAGDGRLDEYRSVPDPESLTRRGRFVAEGRLVVRRLLGESRLETRSVMLTPPAYESLRDLLSAHSSLPIYVVPQKVMNEVAGFNFHRGCLAIGTRPPERRWQELADLARRLVVLERLGNVDNVGAIFRSAAAFGVDGVVLQDDCADPLYRKAIRTSMAAALTVPFARTGSCAEVLRQLAASGWMTIALTPAADAPALREVASTCGGRPVAVVLGHEGEGLLPETMAACTDRARIPIAPCVDSLNVATAAAIALYEMNTAPG
jgi:tRNA G18 (ribose-2'-O)-methylase SpoU